MHPLQEIQVDIEGQAITERETTIIQWFLKEVLKATCTLLVNTLYDIVLCMCMCVCVCVCVCTQLLPEGRIDLALAVQEITAQKGIGSVVKVLK